MKNPITQMIANKFRVLRLAQGGLFHAVPVDDESRMPLERALCGATYGRASGGWALDRHGRDGGTVTCKRCRSRLDRGSGLSWACRVTGAAARCRKPARPLFRLGDTDWG